MKHLATIATIALISAGEASAQDCITTVQTITPGKLTVAAWDYPPVSIIGSDGSVTGVDPSIVEAIAKDNCLEVVYHTMEPAATIQSVVSGRADVAIGGWNRTKARSEAMGLSAPTFLAIAGIYSKDGIDEFSKLEGHPVGTVTGYLWVNDLQDVFGSDLKLYPSAVALEQDLLAGRIVAAVDSYIAGINNQTRNGRYQGVTILQAQPDERVEASVVPAQAGLIYTKDNAALGAALDQGIERLRAEGTIAKLITDAGYDAAIADVGEPRLME